MRNQVTFENTFEALPPEFFSRVNPTPVRAPQLVKLNHGLAAELGLDIDWLSSIEGLAVLSGNASVASARPLAMVYAGHQFGQWVPQLGDGRAILLGELIDDKGERVDVQLKGGGRTPYSRGGDGRAWLGPALREYIISEAMHALGVPTTRALAVIATGEPVYRQEALPGAIVVRVARSHIRVGTFQYFYAKQQGRQPAADGSLDQQNLLEQLLDYVLERSYPALAAEYHDTAARAAALLDVVIKRQAALVAQWQSLGFIHGVMNTDNCSITGDTIDYGPCAFMDAFDARKVFSSIDQHGRYAYTNQPAIAHWNLAQLAQSLLPLLAEDQDQAVQIAQDAVNSYPAHYQTCYLQRMGAKLGIADFRKEDLELLNRLLAMMSDQGADFTQTFHQLALRLADSQQPDLEHKRYELTVGSERLFRSEDYQRWQSDWVQRTMVSNNDSAAILDPPDVLAAAANPICIPRNHRIEQVIDSACKDEFEQLETMLEAVLDPYTDGDRQHEYAAAPTVDEEVKATFCGT